MQDRLSRSFVDRLGDRLRVTVVAEDLEALDRYRREFREAYDSVVEVLRGPLSLEVSGRPAKSTAAILDKLARSSMRLTQMQDIAGCRVLVPNRTQQDLLVQRIESLVRVEVLDRREHPSHGYRAVHLIASQDGKAVEIQVRTELQHLWAELSEKMADQFGSAVKYGGGNEFVKDVLARSSSNVHRFEMLELKIKPGDPQLLELLDLRAELQQLLRDASALKMEGS